mmetsp:Transcript_111506/g.310510  ORF Transcript_111506/g.310510 Transcript_111506/m.310510 type:complete len:209 (+) Transcript_111506:68-694(+)
MAAKEDEAQEAPWRSEVARLELQLGELRDAVVRDSQTLASIPALPLGRGGGLCSTVPALRPAAAAPAPAAGPQAPDEQLAEMYRELENLELALVQERQRVHALLEEKSAREVSHARDIAELEGMLKQATCEKDRLVAENRRLLAEVSALRAGMKDAPFALPDWSSMTSCTASEPEIERSGDFDFDRLSRLSLGSPSSPQRRASLPAIP